MDLQKFESKNNLGLFRYESCIYFHDAFLSFKLTVLTFLFDIYSGSMRFWNVPEFLCYLIFGVTLLGFGSKSNWSGLFPPGLPIRIWFVFLFAPCMLHVPPIKSFFIWSLYYYIVKSTNYLTFLTAVLPSLLSLHP